MPMGLIPVLHTEGWVLNESPVIARHVARKFGTSC